MIGAGAGGGIILRAEFERICLFSRWQAEYEELRVGERQFHCHCAGKDMNSG